MIFVNPRQENPEKLSPPPKSRKDIPWYGWVDDEDFRTLCGNTWWRNRVRELLWDSEGADVRCIEVGAKAWHLERLGCGAEYVDDYAYREAVLTFTNEYSVPDSYVKLTPKEQSLFDWGVSMGLPLL